VGFDATPGVGRYAGAWQSAVFLQVPLPPQAEALAKLAMESAMRERRRCMVGNWVGWVLLQWGEIPMMERGPFYISWRW
jgi:hypothetical protein